MEVSKADWKLFQERIVKCACGEEIRFLDIF